MVNGEKPEPLNLRIFEKDNKLFLLLFFNGHFIGSSCHLFPKHNRRARTANRQLGNDAVLLLLKTAIDRVLFLLKAKNHNNGKSQICKVLVNEPEMVPQMFHEDFLRTSYHLPGSAVEHAGSCSDSTADIKLFCYI